jgi:NADH-quinone oxidoreductase subunit A
MSLMIG